MDTIQSFSIPEFTLTIKKWFERYLAAISSKLGNLHKDFLIKVP